MAKSHRAEHRTILVVDVEAFGDWRRTNANQVMVRGGMYKALRRALEDAEIPRDGCRQEDRGDGVFILASPGIPKELFAEAFPRSLAEALGEHNRKHGPEEQIRLRMALHAGEIKEDEHGVTGAAINHAFRLLNAAPLKTALRRSPGLLAVIASSWFFDEVIRHGEECHPDTYRPVLIHEKETSTVGWVTLPDHPNLAQAGKEDESWRIRILGREGGNQGAGVLVRGRYAITTASAVAGASGVLSAGSRPSGPVFFDLPHRPQIAGQRAEIIWWRPPVAAGDLDLAGLSVAGPPLRGIAEPPLERVGPAVPQIARIPVSLPADDGHESVRIWARLSNCSGDAGQRIALTSITGSGPPIAREFSGAGVRDAETGAIIGIVTSTSQPGNEGAWLATVNTIADDWPLLGSIVAAAEASVSGDVTMMSGSAPASGAPFPRPSAGKPACRLERDEFIQLIDRCMQMPELAAPQSRHTIISELSPEIALSMPRSSVDRADIAALLWACVEMPTSLAELSSQIRRKTRDRNGRQELLADLDRLQAKLLS